MSKKDQKKERRIIIFLVFLIVFIAIVFSKITGDYIVEKTLLINPNRGEFVVVFSSSPTRLETNPVIGYPLERMNSYGFINNFGHPRITNLSAKLKKPGDYVTYNFYIMNLGNYDAYLTDIIYNYFEGTTSFKSCSSPYLSAEEIGSICDSINLQVNINNGFKLVTTTGTTGVQNHLLRKRTSEPISITIRYLENGVEANAPINVNFSDIDIFYKLVDKK